jgi:hypothetical protein
VYNKGIESYRSSVLVEGEGRITRPHHPYVASGHKCKECHHAGCKEKPIAQGVEPREGNIPCTYHQRKQEVSKGTPYSHRPPELHENSVEGKKLIVMVLIHILKTRLE